MGHEGREALKVLQGTWVLRERWSVNNVVTLIILLFSIFPLKYIFFQKLSVHSCNGEGVQKALENDTTELQIIAEP